MPSPREIEREARAYCEKFGLDPDEDVGGYFDTGEGRAEWTRAPRWSWYKGANLSQDAPLTGFQKAILEQQAARDAALALSRAQKRGQPPAFVRVDIPLNVGVYLARMVPREALEGTRLS